VYTVLNGLVGLLVFVSGGRLEPREYDLKEYWSWKGGGRPPWYVRAIRDRSKGKSNENEHQDSDDAHEERCDSLTDSHNGCPTKVEPVALTSLNVSPLPGPDTSGRFMQ
jgi:AGZA family xanthine/uracil permease-like MFS transporter